jgi:hypothetical protein
MLVVFLIIVIKHDTDYAHPLFSFSMSVGDVWSKNYFPRLLYIHGHIQLRETWTMKKNIVIWLFSCASLKWSHGVSTGTILVLKVERQLLALLIRFSLRFCSMVVSHTQSSFINGEAYQGALAIRPRTSPFLLNLLPNSSNASHLISFHSTN